MSYLRARLASAKPHPLRVDAGEAGRGGCAVRLWAPSSRRKGEASGEGGKDGEEGKGDGGEARGDEPRGPSSAPGPSRSLRGGEVGRVREALEKSQGEPPAGGATSSASSSPFFSGRRLTAAPSIYGGRQRFSSVRERCG